MISNEDPTGQQKAFKQMIQCNVFNTLIPCAMALPSVGLIHPLVLAPFMLYQIKNFQAMFHFRREAGSVQSAKQVKKTAYFPFVVLLLGFFGTTAFNRFVDRRKRDQHLFECL